eukprot:6197619-Pleurochrysis_carterae.AAC.2
MGRGRIVGIGEARCLNSRCRVQRHAGSTDGCGRRRRPREARFVEIYVRGYNNAESGDENVVRTVELSAKPKIHAYPSLPRGASPFWFSR